MAFPTSANQVQAFAGALYGVQIGTVTMAQVTSDIAALGGLNNALNSYYAASFGGLSTATVATTFATNLGLTGAALTAGAAYVEGQLNAVAPSARGAVIANILNLFAGLTADATFGQAATTWNTKVEAAAAYTGVNNVAIGTVVPTNTMFTLTTGTDVLTMTDSSDMVIAQLGAVTSLQSSDQIYGNNGSDTLRVVTDGASAQAVAGFQLSSVEKIEVQSGATGGTALGLAGANAALATVISTGSTSNVALNDVAKLVSAEISNTTDTSLTLSYAAAAVAGATTQNLAVNAASATFNAAGVEVVNVTATGANTLAFGTAPTTVNVAGAGTLNLGTLTPTTTTVNAAQNSGGVTAELGAAATATATGGSGADTLNVSAVTGNATVAAGAGNDMIIASSTLTATDVIDGGSGQDTLVVSGTIADAELAKVTSIEALAAAGSLTVTLGAAAKAAGITGVTADGANNLTVTTSAGFDSALTVTLGTGSNTVNNTGNAALTVIGTETNLATAVLTGGTGTDTLQISATDAATLNLSNVTGFEVINVVPNATTAGTAVKLVLGVNTVAAGKTLTINAAALTATGATLEVDTSAAVATATVVIVGGSNADAIIGGAGKHNISGGAGADVFDFSGTTLSADTTINGGDGSDILKVASVTAAALANVSNVENLAFTTNTSLNANIPFTSFDLGAVDGGQQLTLATGYINATTVKLGQAGDKIDNDANVALTVNSTVTAANAAGAVQGGTATDTLTLTGGGSLSLASNVTAVEIINLVDRGDAAPAEGVTNDRGVDYTIITGNYESTATTTTVLTINGADLDAGVLNAEGVMITGSDEVLTVNASEISHTSSLVAVSVVGGSAADEITGGNGNDTILGGAGNDAIDVRGGDNAVNGGDGNDQITATSTGNNILLGGAGEDTFILNGALTGEDSIDGGAGVNTLEVNAAVTNLDLLNVYNVQTLKLASSGTTTLVANAQAAGFSRVNGTSFVDGGLTGNDIVSTTSFTRAVSFVSGTGNDNLTGGAGDDVFVFSASQLNGSDTLAGGAGVDTIRLDNASAAGAGAAVTATLQNVTGIERVVVNDLSLSTDTAGDVTIAVNTNTGDGARLGSGVVFVNNLLTIDGSSLDLGETLTVDARGLVADTVGTTAVNESENLSVIGGAGSDTITAGAGKDTLDGGSGADQITGGEGADSISGGDGRDYLVGGTGNDTIGGGNGTDIMIGGAGKDHLSGALGNDTFVFETVAESTGEDADVISDFVSGSDKIFIKTSSTGNTAVTFKGNAANFEAAQALLVVEQAGAVYNQATRTLWIDANKDGTLNANDFQIVLQNGPAALVAADITSGATSPVASSLVTWSGSLADYATAAVNLETEDTVSIIDTAANIDGSLAAILADTKVDIINATPNGTIFLTLAQATVANLAKFTDGDDSLVLRDTVANLQALTASQITALKTAGIDSFDSLSNALSLSVAQANAMTNASMTGVDVITIADTATAIQALTDVQISGFSNVDKFDSSGDALSLSAAQAIAMGTGRMTVADVVTVAGTGGVIAGLATTVTGTDLANVDFFDASSEMTLTVAKAQSITSARMMAADAITVADAASAIEVLSAAAIEALANVDKFDSTTGNALSISVAQALAMGSARMESTDTVTVADAGAAIAALTVEQITALANVDKFDASSAMTLSLAQAQAMGAKQTTADAVTVTATGAEIAALTTTATTGQVALLAAWGANVIDLTDNQIAMTESAYAAFKATAGSMEFASGDRVNISGVVGGNSLAFSGGDVALSYTSGAQASIVTFADVVGPTQITNTDTFSLANADVVTGFNSGSDTIDLSNFGLSGLAQVTDFTTSFTVLRDASYYIVQGTWTASAGSTGSFAVNSSGTDSLVLFDANTGTGNTAINMVGVVIDESVLTSTNLVLV